jgi:serine/threonine protein kinase
MELSTIKVHSSIFYRFWENCILFFIRKELSKVMVLEKNQLLFGKYVNLQPVKSHEGPIYYYMARSCDLKQPVFIYYLDKTYAKDTSIQEKILQRNIEIQSQLMPANVPRVLEKHENENFLSYVSTYIEGESMAAKLDGGNRLPLADAFSIILKLCKALQGLMYEDGTTVVAHWGISPEHIICNTDGVDSSNQFL